MELYRKKYRQKVIAPPSQQSLKLLPDVSRSSQKRRPLQSTLQSTASTAITGLPQSRPKLLERIQDPQCDQISAQMADLQTFL